MKESVKHDREIALLGFPSAVADEIEGLIGEHNKLLKVVARLDFKENCVLKVELEREVDLIFLDPTSSDESIERLIEQIKSRHPLTEIVMVSFEEDYHRVLSAFRAGVRDILNYPLDKKLFIEALENSLGHRELYRQSQMLSDVFVMMGRLGGNKKLKSYSDLAARANRFMSERFKAMPFMLLSFNAQLSEDQLLGREFRVLNHQFDIERFYPRNEIENLVGQIKVGRVKHSRKAIWAKGQVHPHYLLIPLGVREKQFFIGIFSIKDIEQDEAGQKILEIFTQLLQNLFGQFLLQKDTDELSSLVHQDDLTGLFNLRRMHLDLDQAIKRHHRDGEQFSVVFIDIDHFKLINDGHGHLVGSKILIQLSSLIKRSLRQSDLAYRYGGDEFVALLPATDHKGALIVANRLLEDIKQQEFEKAKGEKFHLSVSIGVASFPKDAITKEGVLELADKMMYQAKKAGRGQVKSVSELFSSAS